MAPVTHPILLPMISHVAIGLYTKGLNLQLCTLGEVRMVCDVRANHEVWLNVYILKQVKKLTSIQNSLSVAIKGMVEGF